MNAKHTPGPWGCHVGHSDWGLPTAHIIVPEGETGNDFDTWIAEVHSVTPYCIGAPRKDRERAGTQLANARLIAACPTMFEALTQILEASKPGQEMSLSDAIDALSDIWNAARTALSKAQVQS